MDAGIWIAIISSACSLIGVIVTVAAGNSKTQYRIEQLEKKQDRYNNLQERMQTAETDIAVNKEQIKVANHRIDDLEHKTA